MTDTPTPPNPAGREHTGLAGPVLVNGFAMALAMWCTAFVTHIPALDLPGTIAGPAVIAAWVVASVLAARATPETRRFTAAALAGLLAAMLGLLILGSMLVEQPTQGSPAPGTSGLRPGTLVFIPGFLALGAIIGLIGAALASRLDTRRQRQTTDWLARFAILTAVSIAPLILIGGAVTSTDSGMAIRGWPASDTANMFLYPISLMAHPQRFLEHTHRLFGSLVGLHCITLFAYAAATRRRPAVISATAALLGVVILQGVLGGQRVNLNDRVLALIHGISAQLIFALAVAIAAAIAPSFRSTLPRIPASAGAALRALTAALLIATILQIVLGATYRHLRQPHALYTHAAFSIIVVILAVIVGSRVAALGSIGAGHGGAGSTPLPILRRCGKALWHTVTLQFVLGCLAFAAVMLAPNRGAASVDGGAIPAPPWQALITTTHQGVGAIFLALAALNALWVRRLVERRA
jgi:cytochrome c oxidase assembly protein subunit 15